MILDLKHDYLCSDSSAYFQLLRNLVIFDLISLKLGAVGKYLCYVLFSDALENYILFKVVQKYTQEKYACVQIYGLATQVTDIMVLRTCQGHRLALTQGGIGQRWCMSLVLAVCSELDPLGSTHGQHGLGMRMSGSCALFLSLSDSMKQPINPRRYFQMSIDFCDFEEDGCKVPKIAHSLVTCPVAFQDVVQREDKTTLPDLKLYISRKNLCLLNSALSVGIGSKLFLTTSKDLCTLEDILFPTFKKR